MPLVDQILDPEAAQGDAFARLPDVGHGFGGSLFHPRQGFAPKRSLTLIFGPRARWRAKCKILHPFSRHTEQIPQGRS